MVLADLRSYWWVQNQIHSHIYGDKPLLNSQKEIEMCPPDYDPVENL